MKKYLFLITLWAGTVLSVFAQNTINRYEYWFDNDFTQKQVSDITPVTTFNLNTDIPANHLPEGLHSLQVHFCDASGMWSSTTSQFFIKLPLYSGVESKLVSCEYWFDNNYSQAVNEEVTNEATLTLSKSIAVSQLPDGLHSFQIRFKDNSGAWSSTTSQFFIKLPIQAGENSKLTASEYWFDNNYAQAVNEEVTNEATLTLSKSIAVTQLPEGLHSFQIRFKDNSGAWSSTTSQFFIKLPKQSGENSKLSACEYWFDNNYAQAVNEAVTNEATLTLAKSIAVTQLPEGLHSFQIRFKDNSGAWSSTTSQFFIKLPKQSGENSKLAACEYWFDNNYAQAVNEAVTNEATLTLAKSIAVNQLPDGLHSFQIRFKNNSGAWSSTTSQFFVKLNTNSFHDNNIVAYEYWFNDSIHNKTHIEVDPINPLELKNTLLPVKNLNTNITKDNIEIIQDENGNIQFATENRFLIRFKDVRGSWSYLLDTMFTAVIQESTVDLTGFIINPDANNNNTGWTQTGTFSNLIQNSEHWSGQTNPYFNFGNTGRTGWNSSISQTIDGLPAGTYILSATGRAATASSLSITVAGISVDFPSDGATGGEIWQDAKEGSNERNCNNGTGFGWSTRSIVFTTDGSPFDLTVNGTTEQINQWCNIDQFTLIANLTTSLKVNFPDSLTALKYSGKRLILSNISKGTSISKIVAADKSYLFNGLATSDFYKLELVTEIGSVITSVDSIKLKSGENSITLDHFKDITSVALKVFTPDGDNVTVSTTIQWYSNNKYLTQNDTLKNVVVGSIINYQVNLNSSLGHLYRKTEKQAYTVTNGMNNITYTLQPIDSVVVKGTVRNQNNWEIQGASISVQQWLNRKYQVNYTTQSDKTGNFTLPLLNDSTFIAISAPDYISKEFAFSNFNDSTNLGIIKLQQISGLQLTTNFTFTESAKSGELPLIQSYYSDYRNIEYQLFNVTQNKRIEKIQVQYPLIIVQDETKLNDQVRITASSKTGDFNPVTRTVNVNEELLDTVTFDLVELGAIEASYTNSANATNLGILYNAKGQLVKKSEYSGGTVAFKKLIKGSYTLVSMGSSNYFSSVLNLSDLSASGLVSGTDYIANTINVEDGVIATITISDIPTFDETKLYYTGTNTLYSVNKTSVVAGNYVTLTAKVDFKEEYKGRVSNFYLIADVPDSCAYVENSLIIGSTLAEYSYENNRITVPLTDYKQDRIRFCLVPSVGGTYTTSAFVKFDIDGITITQPIGSTSFTAANLSFVVPTQTAKKTISVSGSAPAFSTVTIYDGSTVIGQTTTTGVGSWMVNCQLYEAYNLTTHPVSAKIRTSAGIGIETETKNVEYNVSLVEVKTVTMINTAHGPASLNTCEYKTVFDFQNPKQTMDPYWYWPSYPDFTFIIDFTNNDTTYVSDVTLYVKTSSNEIVPVKATYNKSKDIWIATRKFNSNSLPVNLSVDYNTSHNSNSILLDNEYFEGLYDWLSSFVSDTIIEVIDTTILDTNLENTFKTMTVDEFIQYLSTKKDTLMDLDYISYFDSTNSDNYFFSFSDGNGAIILNDCSQLSDNELLEQGFTKYEQINNNHIYYKIEEGEFAFVDLQNNVYYQISSSSESFSFNKLKSTSSSDIDDLINKSLQITSLADHIDDLTGLLTKRTNSLLNKLFASFSSCNKELEKITTELQYLNKYESKGNLSESVLNKIKEIRKNKISYRDNLLERIGKYGKQIRAGQKILNKICSFASIIMDAKSAKNSISEWISLIETIEKTDCPGMEDLAIQARIYANKAADNYIWQLRADVVSLYSLESKIGTLISLASMNISLYAGNLNLIFDEQWKTKIRLQITTTNCKDLDDLKDKINDKDKEDGNGGGQNGESGSGNTGGIQDPSGYVYEAVTSNRLPSVTTTIYYKTYEEDMYGDWHEVITKWDAEPYLQDNPLITDENGVYAWDVPDGLWQVKYEKEGYETQYSNWLPVPPPQLDINVGLWQSVPPIVKNTSGYTDNISFEFTKFMQPATLIASNIIIYKEGVAIDGTIQILNSEVNPNNKLEGFASKVSFIPTTPFVVNDEVTLWVSQNVKSYAGTKMTADYSQTIKIKAEIKITNITDTLQVAMNSSGFISVTVSPKELSAGKKIVATSTSPSVATVQAEATLDDNGTATLDVCADLPGFSMVNVTYPEADLKGESIVLVSLTTAEVKQPTASIVSGARVNKNSTVSLSCEEAGATIHYTTDGSNPGSSATAIVYNTPIAVANDVTIKAIATKEGMQNSAVVTFIYGVIQDSHINAEICNGDSYQFDGKELFNAGTYYDTIQNSYGFDSISVLNLVVNQAYTTRKTADICSGDYYYFNNTRIFQSGIYYDTLTTVTGCDSILVLDLEVNDKFMETLNIKIQEGDSIEFAGKYLKEEGTYFNKMKNIWGCDSIYILNLDVHSIDSVFMNATICSGDRYLFEGDELSSSGIYYHNLTSSNGFDSILVLELTVNENYLSELTVDICKGDNYSFAGKALSQTGIYYDSLTTINGCDSIIVLELEVHDLFEQTIKADIQDGDTYFLGGKYYSQGGIYYDSLQTAWGCDSVYILDLKVHQSDIQTIDASICKDKGYLFADEELFETGIYFDTLQNSLGFDSILILNLIVNENYLFEKSIDLCQGDSYSFLGNDFTHTGIYYDSLTTINGCDSIIVLNLEVHDSYEQTINADIQDGDTYSFGSKYYSESGIYYDSLQTTWGCDSVYILNLKVHQSDIQTIDASICKDDGYWFADNELFEAGIYYDTLQNSLGFDSILILNLTVNENYLSELSAKICQGDFYSFAGEEITQAGTYYDSLSTVNGCDSIFVLQLESYVTETPFNLSVIEMQNKIYLEWEGTSSNYLVYRNNDSLSVVSNLSFVDSTAINGQIYSYSIQGSENDCLSEVSEEVQILKVTTDEISNFAIVVYPNPTEGLINIKGLPIEAQTEISISNSKGQVILRRTCTERNESLDISFLERGIYYLRVDDAGMLFKITKQ